MIDTSEFQVFTYLTIESLYQTGLWSRSTILAHEREELGVDIERLVLEAHKLASFQLGLLLSESSVACRRAIVGSHGEGC